MKNVVISHVFHSLDELSPHRIGEREMSLRIVMHRFHTIRYDKYYLIARDSVGAIVVWCRCLGN